MTPNNSNTNKQEMTLWSLLQNYRIKVPLIQRDYAQGRKDKTELRKTLLGNLHDSLCSVTHPRMEMDFIYGSNENGAILPLDGQQRLTTLWLLHWYIALKAGKLTSNGEVAKILSRFTYQTRTSSRNFCLRLCEMPLNKDTDDIYDHIVNQPWFYTLWKQDPTVQSMLRMMRGTSFVNQDNETVKEFDGIEQVFSPDLDYNDIWNILISSKCPIRFYFLPLEGLKLSDDLYIKMNSRGKPLTGFENFKADFIGYLSKEVKTDKEWSCLLNPLTGIPIKMDTDWSEIFWKSNKVFWEIQQSKNADKKVEFKIDDVYYTFINRFFFSYLLSYKPNEEKYAFTAEDLEKTNTFFRYYYGPEVNRGNDDTIISYTTFEKYLFVEKESGNKYLPLGVYLTLQKVLDNFASMSNIVLSTYFPERHQESAFEFIPKYREKNGSIDVRNIPQHHRVIFFAVLKYFEISTFNETTFRQWMRVVWNIVDDADIDGISTMISAIRRIDAISSGANDIYSFFANRVKEDFKDDQTIEEYYKAIAINNNIVTESELLISENHHPFNGTIRFLIYNGDGEPDWSNYSVKKDYALSHINESLCGNKKKNINSSLDPSMLQIFYSHIDYKKMCQLELWKHRMFNNYPSSWRYYLTHKAFYPEIESFLLQKDTVNYNPPSDAEGENYWPYVHHHLTHGGLLSFVMKEIPNSWLRVYHNHQAIFPSSTGVFLNAYSRDRFLSSGHVLTNNTPIENTNFRFGSDIDFKYNDIWFKWYRDDKIKLLDKEMKEVPDLSFQAKHLNDEEILEKLNEQIEIWKRQSICQNG